MRARREAVPVTPDGPFPSAHRGLSVPASSPLRVRRDLPEPFWKTSRRGAAHRVFTTQFSLFMDKPTVPTSAENPSAGVSVSGSLPDPSSAAVASGAAPATASDAVPVAASGAASAAASDSRPARKSRSRSKAASQSGSQSKSRSKSRTQPEPRPDPDTGSRSASGVGSGDVPDPASGPISASEPLSGPESGSAGGPVQATAPPTFADFAQTVYPFLELQPFHRVYYRVLEAFAQGRIPRLIVTMPPQHGKSVGATTLLPAYLLGLDPDCRVAIASYSGALASKFNRRVQRILDSREYAEFFPATTIKQGTRPPSYIRTADEVEIIGRRGSLLSVGREGSLTGNRVDCFLLDDLYKDAMEANSPLVRANCWEWYTSVVRTRMHNRSRELVVFTRWHEEDLIGSIAAREPVEALHTWAQLDAPPAGGWLHLNFEALKASPPTELDPRAEGEALWEEQQGAALLAAKRRLDPLQFEAMYQGHPTAREGLLYGLHFAEYDTLPREIVRRASYTDTADTGDDYLCSLAYVVDVDGVIYITDAVYTRDPMEVTERLVAEMFVRSDTRQAAVESNNGGRGFARAVQALAPDVRVEWFHQSGNKEARILSNAATALHLVRFPRGWALRWPELYGHLTTYRRTFRANRWHDAADVVTGIVEREAADRSRRRLRGVRFL